MPSRSCGKEMGTGEGREGGLNYLNILLILVQINILSLLIQVLPGGGEVV